LQLLTIVSAFHHLPVVISIILCCRYVVSAALICGTFCSVANFCACRQEKYIYAFEIHQAPLLSVLTILSTVVTVL